MKSNLTRTGLVLAASLLMLFGTISTALAWTLSGTIYGGSNPLANATVTAYNATDQSEVGSSTTNSSGVYSITVNNGTYNLLIAPPMVSGLANSVVNGVAVNGANVLQNAVLVEQAKIISGILKLSDGTLVSGVTVSASGTATGNSSVTNTQGAFSILVSSGTFSLKVTKYYPTGRYEITPVTNLVVAGDITQDITLNVLPALSTLSGKTTHSNGVPVGNVKIEFKTPGFASYYSLSGGCANFSSNQLDVYTDPYGGKVKHSCLAVTSDAGGNYSVNLISAASGYIASLIPPSGNLNLIPTTYNISVPDITPLNLALTSSTFITGTLKLSDGTLVSGVTVSASGTGTGNSVVTNSQGYFSMPVSNGTFSLKVTKYYPTGRYEITPVTNLVVAGDITQDITLNVLPALSTLSGKTTDSNGVPVGNVKIEFKTPGFASYYSLSGGCANFSSNQLDVYTDPDGGKVKHSCLAVTSDAGGNYSVNLISAASGYIASLIPPNGSNFIGVTVANINVATSVLQNWVLSLPDTKPPIILSGPTVSSKSDTTATIEWQTNEPAKGGVTYGTSNPPTTTVAESTFKSTHSLPLTGLTANTTYYIKVTATDSTGNGPTTSQIISFTTKPTPDVTPPVILTGPTITTITHTSAVVEWTTNEPSIGSVVYGLTSVPDLTVADSTLTTSHRVTLTGLTAQTAYYLNTTATDAVSNGPTASPIISFRTVAAPDTDAPVIVEGPMVINISDTGATVVWKTDEPATSAVSWNNGTVHDLVTDDTNFTINHSVRLTGLSANTTYSYTVSSKDAASNGPTLSVSKTFTTLPLSDTTPPVFTESPLVVNVTHQSAVIRWRTDEPADGVIEYGTSKTFGSNDSHAALTQPHNMTLTGLSSGTIYYFRVSSKDAAGNDSTYSATGTFTTDDHDKGKIPVVTVTPAIIHKDDDKGVVYWETDEPCDTVVEYGEGSELTNQNSNGEKVNKHQATITNLKANTSYNVKVSCTNTEGHRVEAKAGTPSTFMAFNMGNILSDAMINATGATGFVTQSQPDTTAPVITVNPSATAISGTQATITWTTDEIADSQVNYNLSGQALTLSAGDITKVFSHSIVLTNLTPVTAYSFTVTSTDPSGNMVSSSTISFTTTELTRSVSFNSNGGSAVASQNVANNGTVIEPATLTKTGSTFAGWFSDAGLTSAFAFTTAITADTTLYANWTINNYTVTFTSNGGSSVSNQSIAYNTVATAPAAPTKAGSTFAEWFSDAGLTSAFAFTTAITADTALYARWTTFPTYKVIYNGNNNTGGVVPSDSNVYLHGETAAVPNNTGLLTKTGYNFNGWNTSVDGSGTNYSWASTFVINNVDVMLYAVYADVTKPIIVLSTLDNIAITNNATLNISGTVSDNAGAVKSLTVNGQTATIASDGSFSVAVTLITGSNTITTIATDNADNQATDTRTITLDQTGPVLTVSAPADNSKTAQALAKIIGAIDETSTVSVKLNSASPQFASIIGSTYSADLSLASGLNNIIITATDLAGNTSSAVRTVTYDNTNPSLSVLNPSQDISTSQNSIAISGSVTDSVTSVAISIEMDGQVFAPFVGIEGSFSQTINLPTVKTYAIIVTATDQAGNTTTSQRNIIKTSPSATGDVNVDGHVDIADALKTLRIAVGLDAATPDMRLSADVAPLSGGMPAPDGVVDIADALVILKKAVGLVSW